MDTGFKKIRDLYDIRENSSGIPEAELVECEKRLSVRLPLVLREYYMQLGYDGFNRKQDMLLLPEELIFVDHDYLLIYTENQGVSVWGIKKQDLLSDNPAVYISLENNLPHGSNIWEYENTLCDFLISMAYLQSLYVFPYSANSIYISEETERFVRENWNHTNIRTKIWGTEFFQNDPDEVIAILKTDTQTDLFVAARSEKKLKETDEKLNVDWEYYSLA